MTPALDPVTREVILNGFTAIVAEMEVLIGRAAMSPSFKDKKDYFMGLYDRDGRMVHALTSYSGAGLVRPVLERYDADSIAPGDVFFYNDPYSSHGAVQHLPDIVVLMPYHSGAGRLEGFAVAYGHLEDIGGLRYGSASMDARDTFNEGVAYPPMRVGTDGAVDDWFLALLTRNSRAPHLVRGDWRALLAGCRLGVDRMRALQDRWGADAVAATAAWTIATSARRARAVLDEQIPDGRYEAEQFVDGTAAGRDRIRVHAVLTKSGADLVLDLTGSDDQVDVPLNYLASLPGARLLLALQLLVFDADLGMNEGALSTLTELRVRPGSIVQPHFPAPLHSRSAVKNAVAGCLATLLAKANGGRMTAPMPGYVVCHFAFDGGAGRSAFGETLGVGLGARPFGDGADVIYGGAQRNYPVEQVEPETPVRIERYEIRRDSGGPGLHRGGCGVRRELRVLADAVFSPRLGNTAIPSPGVGGGLPGGLGKVTVVRRDGTEQTYPGVHGDIPVRAGELVRLESSGGGGFGDPLDRPAAAVLRDVREGFVSVEQARAAYGVWIADGELDETATLAGPRGARSR
ncbi:hydantoinase B/oxoprolinase family protein [Actinomadura rayongensis]|uniref:Hydantoinase B/oxoprolinase domain-containing protein n=1 Tax=Actinomadura rayongensis TaxID=1429076 RepID=A0A6I4WG38_9ACTN|nr:hydantoinase B/oxoprolinase family protein [Actinomadura rayongensis]MXQ67840.1 hypothetical protein [Actinomadura rayongensis]